MLLKDIGPTNFYGKYIVEITYAVQWFLIATALSRYSKHLPLYHLRLPIIVQHLGAFLWKKTLDAQHPAIYLPFLALMVSRFHKTLKLDRVRRSKELRSFRWGSLGPENLYSSNFKGSVKNKRVLPAFKNWEKRIKVWGLVLL